MLGILIFDHLNDLIYIKSDHSFLRHVQGMAIAQGLTSPSEISNVPAAVEPNLLVQLFSPLITSHQVMDVQFGNPYSSITCHDNTTIALQKYEGCVFVCVGRQEEEELQRLLNIVIRLTKLLVGPCVNVLRESSERRRVLGRLVKAWLRLVQQQQCYLVEAVERLLVGPDIAAPAVQVLSQVLDKMKSSSNSSNAGLIPCHALLLVRNKLLALYSSRSAQELSASDILLLNLLLQQPDEDEDSSDGRLPGGADALLQEDCMLSHTSAEEKEAEEQATTLQDVTLEQLEGEEQRMNSGVSCHSSLVLLKTELSVFTPHLVHYTTLHHNLSLVVVSEIGRSRVSGSIMSLLQCVSSLSSSSNTSLDVCQATLLQTQQLARKLQPGSNTDAVMLALEKVELQWLNCRRSGLAEWQEQQSNGGGEENVPSRVEAAVTALQEGIRTAWRHISLPYIQSSSVIANNTAQHAAIFAKDQLASYAQFIDVKSMSNPKFECRSLTVNRYMDDFPGLVHFIYIDRSRHQLTAPSLDLLEVSSGGLSASEGDMAAACLTTRQLTKQRVWSMVDVARSHLSNGQHSVMWKDTTFSYAYFLWFEDKNNIAQVPEELDEDVLSALPRPGILSEDFYRLLTAHCFPGTSAERLQVYEVMCVHLGLVTAPCVLEQTRRLLASVWEVTGESSSYNPADLL
uniref:Hermansky-Pudlak syndrome 1 protein homolog n=3 Tax=Hirondellea gigas TaxID=1518452 RepID=A0A6A7G668_9CRUS